MVKKQKMHERWQVRNIRAAMKTRRVLLLSGARQCGKTTVAKDLFSGADHYRNLDDLALYRAASVDPHGFVKHNTRMLVIDEVQRVPELVIAVKKQVDEDNRTGQYLLTGSANIQSLPTVKESLAGRVQNIRLRPLTQGEMLDREPVFLQQAFKRVFKAEAGFDRDRILDMAFRGGFPEPALRLGQKGYRQWFADYVNALLERDLRDIANVYRVDALRQLLTVMAAWSSKFMDVTAIQSKLSIQRATVEAYLNALEVLYVIERVLPWVETDYARVGKQSKVFLTDSGLMCALLKWKREDVQFDSDRAGKLVESFVFNELAAQIDVHRDKYQLFHYRDREQREIDFVVERDDGALLGIEVKAGSALSSSHFKHLRWFKENIAKKKSFIGVVLYTGDYVVPFGKDMWGVPISALWADSDVKKKESSRAKKSHAIRRVKGRKGARKRE